MCDAGPEMTFHFGQLIAHYIAKTRNVRAGSIVGSGTVSNKRAWSRTAAWNGPRATAALPKALHRNHPGRQAHHRVHEVWRHHPHRGQGQDGASIFGAIDQEIAAPGAAT